MQTIWLKRGAGALLGGLAVVGVIVFAWPRPVAVDLAMVAKGPMEVTVDDEGKTRVRHVYTVSAPIAGKVLRISRPNGKPGISVHVGDEVTANQTVVAVMQPAIPAFIDVRSREELQAAVAAADAAIALAEAEIRRIEAALGFSRDELLRAQALSHSGTIAAKTLDKAKLEVAVNEAALASAKAQLGVRRSERASVAARLIDPANVLWTKRSKLLCPDTRARHRPRAQDRSRQRSSGADRRTPARDRRSLGPRGGRRSALDRCGPRQAWFSSADRRLGRVPAQGPRDAGRPRWFPQGLGAGHRGAKGTNDHRFCGTLRSVVAPWP
jgi:multidrug efflux pump subunit AcrA (membrane-fusion protein)